MLRLIALSATATVALQFVAAQNATAAKGVTYDLGFSPDSDQAPARLSAGSVNIVTQGNVHTTLSFAAGGPSLANGSLTAPPTSWPDYARNASAFDWAGRDWLGVSVSSFESWFPLTIVCVPVSTTPGGGGLCEGVVPLKAETNSKVAMPEVPELSLIAPLELYIWMNVSKPVNFTFQVQEEPEGLVYIIPLDAPGEAKFYGDTWRGLSFGGVELTDKVVMDAIVSLRPVVKWSVTTSSSSPKTYTGKHALEIPRTEFKSRADLPTGGRCDWGDQKAANKVSALHVYAAVDLEKGADVRVDAQREDQLPTTCDSPNSAVLLMGASSGATICLTVLAFFLM